MGPIFSVLFVLSLGLISVFAEGVAVQEASAQASMTAPVGQAPTTSDMYCAGFFTNIPVDASLEILSGEAAGYQNEFMERDIVYLNKGRERITTPGVEYMVVRPTRDINPRESFEGQQEILKTMGTLYTLYTEVARIQASLFPHARLRALDEVRGCQAAVEAGRNVGSIDRKGLLQPFAQAGGCCRMIALDHPSELFYAHDAFLGLGQSPGGAHQRPHLIRQHFVPFGKSFMRQAPPQR